MQREFDVAVNVWPISQCIFEYHCNTLLLQKLSKLTNDGKPKFHVAPIAIQLTRQQFDKNVTVLSIF